MCVAKYTGDAAIALSNCQCARMKGLISGPEFLAFSHQQCPSAGSLRVMMILKKRAPQKTLKQMNGAFGVKSEVKHIKRNKTSRFANG